MADQNKSNKGNPNVVQDSGISEIENIGRRASRHTAEDIAQRIRLAEARRNVSTYEAALQTSPSEDIAALIGRQLASERKAVNSLEPRIGLRAETQRQRFTNLTQSAIERNFQESSVNGQAAEFARSTTGQRFSLGSLNTPYEELEARRQRTMNSIGALGQRASNLAESLYDESGKQDPQKLQQLQGIYSQRNRLVNMVGGIDAAMRAQRRQGLDPESRQDKLFEAGNKAQNTLFREAIAQELASGKGELGGKSANELKTREIQLSAQLVEALEKLKDTAGKSAEEIDKMKESASKTADDLEKVKEARAQAAGGGGNDRYTNASNILGFAQNAFNAVGGGIQAIGVNQRMQQTANIAGYASIENQKYQTYKAAAAGDIASQLALSQFGEAEDFGRSLRKAANVAVGAQIAGGIAQTAAGGVRLAEATAQKANPLAYASGASTQNTAALLQGTGEVIQGATQTAVAGSALYRDTEGSAAAIAGVNAQMEAGRQLSMVTANQLQGFRDFSVGMGQAAIGMGSRGGAFLDRTINKSNMEAMVNSRISPEQMAQMAQIGVQQIGSTFNESQIFGARGLERSGLGTMQENMQRMATLASAGTNNPKDSLGGVLEAAVSKGMDSSKAINTMIENTAQMAKTSFAAAAGLDVTGAAATVLSANIDPKNGNQEFAAQRAMTAQEVARNITTNTDVSFSGMVNTSRISKKTGLGGDDAVFAAKLTTEELKALQGKSDGEIKSYMLQKGINPNNANLQPKELVNSLLDSSRETLMEARGAGFAFGSSKLRESLSEKAKTNVPYEKLSDEEKALLGKLGGGAVTGKEFYGTALGIGATNAPNAATDISKAMEGKGGTEQQKMLDDMRTQGFKQLSQAALEATVSFKTAADALKVLGQMAKSVENFGDKGGEGKFKTAAADAAAEFGKSTIKFDSAVGVFANAVRTMNIKSGIYKSDNLLERYQKDSDKSNKAGLKE